MNLSSGIGDWAIFRRFNDPGRAVKQVCSGPRQAQLLTRATAGTSIGCRSEGPVSGSGAEQVIPLQPIPSLNLAKVFSESGARNRPFSPQPIFLEQAPAERYFLGGPYKSIHMIDGSGG